MFRVEIRQLIAQAVTELQRKGTLPSFDVPSFAVAAPENPEHGDYATNVALLIAASVGRNPRDIASAIAEELSGVKDLIAHAEVAGQGFINLRLTDSSKAEALRGVLSERAVYGAAPTKPTKVQIEFISANPTGPLTLANGRGGFFGDVLSNVLASQGYQVEREYYVNDAGNQIRTLGLSLLAAAGMASDAEEYYHGDYITRWANAHPTELERDRGDPEALGRLAAADFLQGLIQRSVEEKMSVRFDRWTSEHADLHQRGYVKRAIGIFGEQGLTYEEKGATWLRTTAYGDDKDRVLVTADGFPTYLAADGGHYLETKERGFDAKVLILGADHHGYVTRLQAVARIVGLPSSEVIIMQLVRLMQGGKEVRMSKRRGVYVTIDELIDEVGLDAVRYFFLEKNPETHVDFDLELAKRRSKENPVYYVQYAHARLASLARKGLAAPQEFDVSALQLEQERSLIRQLLQLPEVLEDITRDYRVSRLVRYAYGLAHAFHIVYEGGRILDASEPERSARMALAHATAIVLKKTLNLLGIAAPEEM